MAQYYDLNGNPIKDPKPGQRVYDANGQLVAVKEESQPVAGTYGNGSQASTIDNGNNVGAENNQGPPAGPLTTEQVIQDLINLYKQTDAKNRAEIDKFLGTSLPELESAAAAARRGDESALEQFEYLTRGFSELQGHEYAGDTASDAESLGMQRDAYGAQMDAANRFKGLTGTEMTAQERYILETTRRQEEQDRRAAMDAQLAELSARGARSGGADITAMLGAQQQTSQNRSIQDLGALAQAQERSMRALEGYGNMTTAAAGTAGQMRDAADAMAQFNSKQRQAYDEFMSNYRQQERDSAHSRNKDLFDAQTGVNQRNWNRAGSVFDANARGVDMMTGQNTQNANNIAGAYGTQMGIFEERRAEDALKPKNKNLRDTAEKFLVQGWDPLGINPLKDVDIF